MHKISVGGYLIPVPDIEDLEENHEELGEKIERKKKEILSDKDGIKMREAIDISYSKEV